MTVSDRGHEKEWEIAGSALEAKDCPPFAARAKEHRAQAWRSPFTEVKVEGNQLTVSSKKAGFVINFRYLCLPDSIDPRGPKGAGR
jgi:hypothetical protein